MQKELYRTEDKHGCIIVTERGSKRVLNFDSEFQQSCIYTNKLYYLAHEYTQIMLLGLIFVDAKNMTLLGLGGGGLVHCLNHFYPKAAINVVEIRQLVIDIAYDWFDMPMTENIKVVCDDASYYLQQAQASSVDIIFSDLYEAQGMSSVQAQARFINNAHKTLSDNGTLVLNFHSMPDETSPVMKEIRAMFREIYVCDVYKGNWVLFCNKSEVILDSDELKDRARNLAKEVEMPLFYYFKQMNNISSIDR